MGTIEFQILGQPVRLSVDSTGYSYDTLFVVGNRVKIIVPYSSFGLNSEGVLKSIIIDDTQDMGVVWFDIVYPDQEVGTEVEVKTGTVSMVGTVPLSCLQPI